MNLYCFNRIVVLPALLCVLLVGCATQSSELFLQPVDDDRELGAEVSQQVAEQIGIGCTEQFRGYVNAESALRRWGELGALTRFPPQPSAFDCAPSLPGRQIGIADSFECRNDHV